MTAAEKLATLDDLAALIRDGKRVELIDNSLVELVPPMPEHGRAAVQFGAQVARHFDPGGGSGGRGGWWILTEVEVRFTPRRVLRPDVVGWRRERLPSPWGKWPVDVVPDWVCEVISPGNEAHDRVLKRRIYASSGVAHYWLLDIRNRCLEALTLRDGRWVEDGVFDESEAVRIAPFAEIELRVGDFLPPLEATAA